MLSKRFVYLIVSFLCSIAICAQHRICGTIVSAENAGIVLNALVEIPALKKTYSIDGSGRFCITTPNTNNLIIIVEAPDYSTQTLLLTPTTGDSLQIIRLKKGSLQLEEIIVTGFLPQQQEQSTETTVSIKTTEMTEKGALNLSDGISKLPGMRQLTTGAGISKPVVRGLYGNRVQVILFGLRFDNQQWQDEHGLGLTTAGVSETEIIKGPGSLYFGSEAMGGVINILPEKNAGIEKTEIDIGTNLFSNTYGYALDAGIKHATEKFSWGIRLNNEAHADYSDGKNTRVLNSRFGNSSAKAYVQFDRKKFQSRTTYFFSQANFGFLMDAYQQYESADARLARSFERPHHSVLLNLISSENTIYLKHSQLKCNLGVFFNNRQEQEGAGGVSLNMLLNSYSGLLSWQKKIGAKTDIVISNQNMYQTNTNIGSRIIVPDAIITENSLAAFITHKQKYLQLESGLRYDYRTMHSKPTGALNNGDPFKPGSTIVAQNRSYNTVNGAAGISFFPNKIINAKFNICSGYRSPNLAEYSSNGLHEGSLRYEIGNTNLKVEQNLCGELSLNVQLKGFKIWMNTFYNHFLNYIYLQRTNEEYLGFTIYRYVQKDAALLGGESGVGFENKLWAAKLDYSIVQAKTLQGENLPFIPANRFQAEVRLKLGNYKRFSNSYARINTGYVLAQNTPAQFETATPGYNLLSAGLGTKIKFKKQSLDASLNGNNLLNDAYVDHLSRLKYFDLLDMGRNISLNLRLYLKS